MPAPEDSQTAPPPLGGGEGPTHLLPRVTIFNKDFRASNPDWNDTWSWFWWLSKWSFLLEELKVPVCEVKDITKSVEERWHKETEGKSQLIRGKNFDVRSWKTTRVLIYFMASRSRYFPRALDHDNVWCTKCYLTSTTIRWVVWKRGYVLLRSQCNTQNMVSAYLYETLLVGFSCLSFYLNIHQNDAGI